MKIKQYYFLFIFLTMLTFSASSQILKPNYPVAAQSLTRGLDTSLLTVQIGFTSMCTEDTVTVQLPEGISYIAGSVTKISGTGSYTITDANLSNLRVPTFEVAGVSTAGDLTFTIKRVAQCGTLVSGKDTVLVKGSCGSNQEDDAVLNTYNISAPSFSLSSPAPITGAIVGSVYNRSIVVTNGGNGDADTVHYFVVYQDAGAENTSGTNDIDVNGLSFSPYKMSGDTLFYKLFGASLFGGDDLLTNGESITINETVEVLKCGPVTQYAAGWGANANNICEYASGSSSISMVGGVPALTSLTRTQIGYVDRCTPYDLNFTAINGGTGNDTAGAMFNVLIQHGYVYPNRSTVQAYNGGIMEYTNGRINGNVITTFTDAGNIVNMDLDNLFPTSGPDPDGPGGLADIDGDGFYDDLARGDTLIYTLNLRWKCDLACGTDKIQYTGARIHYDNMCGDSRSTNPVHSYRPLYESSFTGTAYLPANIIGGTPFRIELKEGHYINSYVNSNTNTRYEWKLVLPPGFSVSGTGNPEYGTTASTYTQVGDSIYIKSTSNSLRDAAIDLVLTCGAGGNVSFDYTLTKIDNDVTNCRCQGNLICATVTAAAFCPGPCPDGPSNYIPVVSRTDGSLGWTDNTMAARQVASAISAYDLSKALFLDTIQIMGTARQNSTVDNLHLEVSLPRAGANNKLAPLDLDVTIIRAGVSFEYNVPASTDNSAAGTQIVNWDISSGISGLPGGTMLPGDSIVTVSRYTVAVNAGLPQNDVQSGGRFFHFSIIGGAREFCFDPVPEMYLVGTHSVDGRNGFYASGCNVSAFGGSGSNLARRFNTSGQNYANEFRPVFYIDSVVMLRPEGYDLVSMTNNIGGGTMTPNRVDGDTFAYINPGTWRPLDLTVTNTYGASFVYRFQPTCKTPATATHGIKFYIKDFYYANATKPTYPAAYQYIQSSGSGNTASRTSFRTQGVTYSTSDKPDLVIQNLTGEVKGSTPQHSWDIEIRNDGLSPAANTWLSAEIPASSGISIDSVVLVSSGTALTPTSYGVNNAWYPISMAGIPSSGTEVARVFFKYSNCSSDSIYFKTGWNCGSYPSPDPLSDPNACNVDSVTGKVVPQESRIQLSVQRQPGDSGTMGRIDLCTQDTVIIQVNSALDANVVNPKIQIFVPTGVVVANPLPVEYPNGSGNYENLTTTSIPGGVEIDLTDHTGMGSDGIPGLIQNPTAPGRQARVLIDFTTNCDHTSGSPLRFRIFGEQPCGAKADGNNRSSSSDGIDITGAVANGAIGVTLNLPNDTFKCNPGVQTLTLVSTPVITGTQLGDTIIYIIPEGTNYKGNFTSISNCATCTATPVSGIAGATLVKIALQPGIASGSTISYSFDVGLNLSGSCTDTKIEAQAKRSIPPLMCGAMICANSSVIVGSEDKDIVVARPQFSFSSYDAANNYPYAAPYKYNYWGSLLNSANVESGDSLIVSTYFDKNQNGAFDRGIDSFIKKTKIMGAVNGGSSVMFADSFTSVTAKPSPTRPLFSILDTADGNCICNALTQSTFLNALPVELMFIRAEHAGAGFAKVRWSTSSEYNSSHFDVYRSTDGVNFENIGTVAAAGNSQSVRNYMFMDDISRLPAGKVFYKLKQVDFNGSFVWTETTDLSIHITKTGVSVSPNPAQNSIEINAQGFAEGVYDLQIFDMSGKLVKSDLLKVSEFNDAKTVDLSALPVGVYTLRVHNESIKLLINR